MSVERIFRLEISKQFLESKNSSAQIPVGSRFLIFIHFPFGKILSSFLSVNGNGKGDFKKSSFEEKYVFSAAFLDTDCFDRSLMDDHIPLLFLLFNLPFNSIQQLRFVNMEIERKRGRKEKGFLD